MKCPNCGSEVPDTAKVCGMCGQRLKSPPPADVSYQPPATVTRPAVPPTPGEQVYRRRGMPGWVWGLIIAVLVLGCIVASLVLFLPTLIQRASLPPSVPSANTQLLPPATPVPPTTEPPTPAATVAPAETVTLATTTALPAQSYSLPDSGNWNLFNRAEVVYSDDFSTLSPELWTVTNKVETHGDNWLHIYADPSSPTIAQVVKPVKLNQAVVFLFALSDPTYPFQFTLSRGTKGTPDFRLVGANYLGNGKFEDEFWNGLTQLKEPPYDGVALEANRMYVFYLVLTESCSFTTRIWGEGDWSGRTPSPVFLSGGNAVASGCADDWTFAIQVDSTNQVRKDNFSIREFAVLQYP